MICEIDDQELNIEEKVDAELAKTKWDALLVFGWDNIQYLSGVQLPFLQYRHDMRVALYWPKNGMPIYICPSEIETSVLFWGRITKTSSYESGGYCSSHFIEAIMTIINEYQPNTIAVDKKRMSHVYHEKLSNALTGINFVEVDKWIENLRMIKTKGEQTLLSDIAYTADHAINGFCHHIMNNNLRSMESNAANLRIHALERGTNNLGYVCTAHIAGHEMNKEYWPICNRLGPNYGFSPDEKCRSEDFIRASINVTSKGYWSTASRPFTYGKVEDWHKDIYGKWLKIRNYMLSEIRSSKKCSDIWEAVQGFAEENEITLAENHSLGHSVGVCVFEKPFIEQNDETLIQDGMILVLTPVLIAPNGEMVQSNDTVLIVEGKPVVVNWWKDWREPYIGIAVQ